MLDYPVDDGLVRRALGDVAHALKKTHGISQSRAVMIGDVDEGDAPFGLRRMRYHK